jgi:hypothetical protein
MLIAPVANATERVSSTTFIHAHTGPSPQGDRRIAVTDVVTKDANGNAGIGTSTPSLYGRFAVYPVNIAGSENHISTVAGSAGAFTSNLRLGVYAPNGALGCSISAIVNYSGNTGTSLAFGTAPVGAAINALPTTRLLIDPNGHVLPGAQNAQDLGGAGIAWRNITSMNALTVTSDADLKQRGAALSDEEILAGKRIADELVWWKWLKSIADNGAAARNHFGPMAQDIAQILVECDVELDWADGKPSFRSDMLCWDEWDAVTQPVMAERIVQKTKIVLVPVDGSDDGTGEPFYEREEITVDEVEQYDTGAVEIVRPAGSEWRIDPSQVAFFLIAAINADTERRLLALENPN